MHDILCSTVPSQRKYQCVVPLSLNDKYHIYLKVLPLALFQAKLCYVQPHL